MGRKKHLTNNTIERKKRKRHNALLAIDNEEVIAHLDTVAKTDAEVVANFLFSLIEIYVKKGKRKFIFWLDNARTHKKRMKTAFQELVEQYCKKHDIVITVEFVHIPPYSPYMNAAEYFIHIIRHRFLRHLPMSQEIEQVVNRLIGLVNEKCLLTKENMENIIQHIKRKPSKKDISFIP